MGDLAGQPGTVVSDAWRGDALIPPPSPPAPAKVVQYVAIPSVKKGHGFLAIAVRDVGGKGKARLLRGKRAKRNSRSRGNAYDLLVHHRRLSDALAHVNSLNALHNLPPFTPR